MGSNRDGSTSSQEDTIWPDLSDTYLPSSRSKSVDYLLQRKEPVVSNEPQRRASLGDATDTDSPRLFKFRSTIRPKQYENSDRSERRSCTTLCRICQNINIETLSTIGGYQHSSLLTMAQSAWNCRLCELILHTHGSKLPAWTLDRFQVVLYLQFADFRYKGILEDHSTTESMQQDIRISQSQFQPGNTRGDHLFSGAELWVETLDIMPNLPDPDRPWASRGFGRPHPNRASTNIVRGRPLNCLTVQSDPATKSGIHWVRDTGSSTASEVSFRIAQGWLRSCLASQHTFPKYDFALNGDVGLRDFPPVDIDHAWSVEQVDPSLPPESLPTTLPARLIEIFSDTLGPDEVCLIKVESRSLEYAALSYCWGQLENADWLTTKNNLSERVTSIRRDELPTTIRDSLVVAQRLGIRYIWIDALCILQGDAEDWAMEAAKMAGIYRGSILTIAASSSSSSDQGCFNTNSKSRVKEDEDVIRIDSTLSDGQTSRLYFFGMHLPPDLYKVEVLDGPLSHRAWTYQEQVLSRRTLHYGASQLFWSCEHCIISEDNFPSSSENWAYPVFAVERPIRDRQLMVMWYLGAVTEFSRRGITYPSDKLVAISALAKLTYLNKHVEYIAGIWKDKMIEGMMWRRDGSGNKSKTYRCPSWSWASQDSPVHFGLATARQPLDRRRAEPVVSYNDIFMPKVLEVSIEADKINPFGNAHGGFLALDTVVAEGLLLARSPDALSDARNTLSFAEHRESWDVNVCMDDADAEQRLMQKVLCALIGYAFGHPVFLLLDPPTMNSKEYRRIGIADFESEQDTPDLGVKQHKLAHDLIDSTKRRTIIIR